MREQRRGRYNAWSNVYPRKARPEQKIDAALALIMAIARWMAAKPARSVYESRGIQFGGIQFVG
jgi:phage terminase large subunit-like protein